MNSPTSFLIGVAILSFTILITAVIEAETKIQIMQMSCEETIDTYRSARHRPRLHTPADVDF